jgi:hypothetical protein
MILEIISRIPTVSRIFVFWIGLLTCILEKTCIFDADVFGYFKTCQKIKQQG